MSAVLSLQKSNPAALLRIIDAEIRHRRLWSPFADRSDGTAHPQRMALESAADIIGYGGQAGGGKTDLLLGAARFAWRGTILRRVYPSLAAIIDRSKQVYSAEGHEAASYNEALHRWSFDTGRVLYFSSVQYDKDVLSHQGQARDFFGFDELPEFTEQQFRFLLGWNRTTRPGQRCRVIATMNPPTTEEGRWVIRFFAPWLDRDYAGVKARPGELRWFTTIAGRDMELADGRPFVLKDGKPCYDFEPEKTAPEDILEPKSRTFIFASVRDNPVLVRAGYIATLQALPEPLRSIMLNGDFTVGMRDDPWCVMPSAWVREAQTRWEVNRGASEGDLEQLGVDVARSEPTMGGDRTVLTARRCTDRGVRVSVQTVAKTASGPEVVGHIVLAKPGTAVVCIDAIGVGSSPVDFARQAFSVYPFNGAEGSIRKTKEGNLGFFNKRASAYWHLRECLDPASGMNVELPPDPELLAELTAARWEMTPRGIRLEAKDEIAKRLGRSPDKADSCVYAFAPREEQGAGLLDLMRHELDEAAKRKVAAVDFYGHPN